ncbi:phage tail-collar fiber domain-containing protein [Shewanella marina]|uniref:phage tail-collar fiber domain-containing protein n=1 Tax=Shewanella marina TaxID=487319 RepID=UPI0004709ABC|nr:phage tail protein [Shewanella marina]
MARLTSYGQDYIAQAVGGVTEFDIDEFVFANIAGLQPDDVESANETMPAANDIVHRAEPSRKGRVDANRVTYSQMLLTDVGDFSFNWIGLCAQGQLVMFAYLPLTQKIKTRGNMSGNTLTRNFVIEHLGIADATPITVSAESWMYEFTDTLVEMQTLSAEHNAAMIQTNTRVITNTHRHLQLSERVRLLENQL